MHPLLDVSTLTVPQLLDKISLANARINAVRVSGQSSSIVNQLKQVMMVYQDELYNRSQETVSPEKVAWDMNSYLEQNKNASDEQEQASIPRWKSAALNELGDIGDSPWG